MSSNTRCESKKGVRRFPSLNPSPTLPMSFLLFSLKSVVTAHTHYSYQLSRPRAFLLPIFDSHSLCSSESQAHERIIPQSIQKIRRNPLDSAATTTVARITLQWYSGCCAKAKKCTWLFDGAIRAQYIGVRDFISLPLTCCLLSISHLTDSSQIWASFPLLPDSIGSVLSAIFLWRLVSWAQEEQSEPESESAGVESVSMRRYTAWKPSRPILARSESVRMCTHARMDAQTWLKKENSARTCRFITMRQPTSCVCTSALTTSNTALLSLFLRAAWLPPLLITHPDTFTPTLNSFSLSLSLTHTHTHTHTHTYVHLLK